MDIKSKIKYCIFQQINFGGANIYNIRTSDVREYNKFMIHNPISLYISERVSGVR